MKHLNLLLALLAALAAAPRARAELPAGVEIGKGKEPSLIQDPEWKKRFLGSYGVLSGVEPQINPTEVELLREVIDLMATDPKAAAARLSKAVGPQSSASVDFVLANLEFQDGRLEAASKHYQSALDKFPDFRRAHKNLGLLRVQQGDCRHALVHLTKAVELGDRDGRNYGLMGYCYIDQEDYLAAEEAYRNAILQEPDTRDWKLGLARSLLAMEKYKEAVALFSSLLEASPEDASLWMLQANAYVGLDDLPAAAVDLEAVRMLGKAKSSSLVLLGDIYMKSGAWDLAKSAYLDAIESDRQGTQFRTAYRAADLLLRTRSYGEAQEILASIDRRYGPQLSQDDKLDVLTLKARLAQAQGRNRDAVQLLESVVKQDGTRGEALLQLASSYHDRGQREKALFLVERAENLEDFEYGALLKHAQFMVSAKDYAKAAELLRRALRIKSEPRVEGFLARVEQAIRP
jgi:tetratricopeptide (TPR) repeat protein